MTPLAILKGVGITLGIVLLATIEIIILACGVWMLYALILTLTGQPQ